MLLFWALLAMRLFWARFLSCFCSRHSSLCSCYGRFLSCFCSRHSSLCSCYGRSLSCSCFGATHHALILGILHHALVLGLLVVLFILELLPLALSGTVVQHFKVNWFFFFSIWSTFFVFFWFCVLLFFVVVLWFCKTFHYQPTSCTNCSSNKNFNIIIFVWFLCSSSLTHLEVNWNGAKCCWCWYACKWKWFFYWKKNEKKVEKSITSPISDFENEDSMRIVLKNLHEQKS